jgi:rubrerythrin
MSNTREELQKAFAGESQANRTYLAFARQADKEGFPQVARLFRAAAEAETVHALNHLRALEGVKSTRENLLAALEGELHEFNEMYPQMMAIAAAEGDTRALKSFQYAHEVEERHAALFEKALKTLGDLGLTPLFVCSVCGDTVEGEPPEKCRVCGTAKKFFQRID